MLWLILGFLCINDFYIVPPIEMCDCVPSMANQFQFSSVDRVESGIRFLPLETVKHIMNFLSPKTILEFRAVCKWSHWLISVYDFSTSLIPISQDSDMFISEILAKIQKDSQPLHFSWGIQKVLIDNGVTRWIKK